DYSSPNVAKNFHVGHLRTTIIGNSLYKIYTKLGYKVERINHLGDWGTQFGKLIVAYKAWGNKKAVENDGVAELMRLYVKFHEEADKNDSLNDEARTWFTKMEQGDNEALEIWKWFVDISLKEYKGTYELLGMEFDHYLGESFYRDKTEDVVNRLQDAGLLMESEGAKIVDLEEYDMPPCLIMKKDGSSIYATRDLAAIFYRKATWNFDKCLYVTGQEQKLHFAQVFKVVELLDNNWAKDSLVHIPYGLVSLEGAKLSTRSGNIIYAEDILLEAIDKVKKTIEEKNPDLENKEEVAKIVGVGAILFHDLYNQRIKDVSFKWDKVLNFDGETGPYVQYTYCRCASILRSVSYNENAAIDYSLLLEDEAIALLKCISRFPQVIADAAEKYEPCVVARFAMDVAQSFSKFYNSCRVIVEDEKLKAARIKIVALTKNTLKDALELLGIDCPEQM
ncbi:MAG: arginine--tRNA ligase, partial [Lachnospiraceae bacterium]|nr:arginine--tRNA ligase [Lachnospiraceae bacterium]